MIKFLTSCVVWGTNRRLAPQRERNQLSDIYNLGFSIKQRALLGLKSLDSKLDSKMRFVLQLQADRGRLAPSWMVLQRRLVTVRWRTED